MQFLYPSFLFALSLVAIPIIIHLFNFRKYKKVVFSDIRFLRQLTEQTKKQQKIKDWLILLCRVLAISFLVFAFAQPFIPAKESQQLAADAYTSVYIDNSYSMQALGKEGSLLDAAKQKAKKIIEAHPASQSFQLLSNDFEGKHQRIVSAKEMLQMIDEIEPSYTHRNLQEVYARQKSLEQQASATLGRTYWLSDFQKNMEPLPIQSDSNVAVYWVPFKGVQQQNIWIDSAWFSDPFLRKGNQNKLHVRVKNNSESSFENQALVLKIDGVQKAIQNITCAAQQRVEVVIPFSLNDYLWHQLAVSITDYPIVFDDVYYLSARAQESLPLLLINDRAEVSAIQKVYGLDAFYALKEVLVNQIDYQSFSKQALIILNEPNAISSGLQMELLKFVKEGGVLLYIPASNPTDLNSIQQFLGQLGVQQSNKQQGSVQLGTIETQDALFAQVFAKSPEWLSLPVVNAYWQLQAIGNSSRTLIQLKNEKPYLLRTKMGKGSTYFLASNLQEEESSLSKHALFVPLMLNLPLQRNHALTSSFVLGEKSSFSFEGDLREKILNLKNGNLSHLISVQTKDGLNYGSLSGQIKEAGVFSLMAEEKEIGKLAFNYPRMESEQGFLDPKERAESMGANLLEQDISMLKSNMERELKGTQFWKLALFLALLFLLSEMALIRWWK
jgi:hypothetical protein